MAYNPEDLKPSCEKIKINDSLYMVLDMITLEKLVLFEEKFGGLHSVHKLIQESPIKLVEVIWILIKDQSEFDNNFDLFYKTYTESPKLKELAVHSAVVFNKIIQKSMPIVINRKRADELSKIMAATTDLKPCYARYYDTLAKRYGYSLDDFYRLTLRQVSALLKISDDEQYKEIELQAALLGRKMKERMTQLDISEEEESEQDEGAEELLARLKQNYKEKK